MSKQDKMRDTIESFEQLGLRKFAQSLRNIQKTQPSFSFKKEQEVFEKLFQIVSYFSKADGSAVMNENYHLPAYSISSGKKHIYFSQFPLKGYTKQEIIGTGLPDYLKNFATNYMGTRSNELYGPIHSKYVSLIDQLVEIAEATKRMYKKVYKPFKALEDKLTPTKQRSTSQESIRTEAKNLNSYLRAMQKFILKIQSEYVSLYTTSLQETKARKLEEGAKALNEIFQAEPPLDEDEEGLASLKEDYIEGEFEDEPQTDEVLRPQTPKKKLKQVTPDLSEEESEVDISDIDLSMFQKTPSKGKGSDEPSASTLPQGQLHDILKNLRKKASSESNIINQLENLTIDFIGIRDQVETKMANSLKMDLSEFRSRFRIEDYIRSFLEIDPTLTKIAQIFDKIDKQEKEKDEAGGLLTPSAPKRYESEAVAKHDFIHQTIRDVLGGRFSYQPYRSTSLHLYSHRDILEAWKYMHLQLAAHYNTFLGTVIRIIEKQKSPQKDEVLEQDPREQEQNLVLVEQELLNRLVRAVGVVGNV
jgi:hypothetical protein